MFEKEALGLQKLKSSKALRIPKVFSHGTIKNEAYLVLEYLPSTPRKEDFWSKFGEGLAKQHRVTQKTFGLEKDNYIGSLPQYNSCKITDAAEFYIEKRLQPQFQLAAKNGFSLRQSTSLYLLLNKKGPKLTAQANSSSFRNPTP